MLPEFQRSYWEEKFRVADWYNQLETELQSFIFPVVHDDPELKAWRRQIYDLLGTMLEKGEVPLAQSGPDLDSDRQPPDTIVIHHTAENPALLLTELSAIGLLRQYGLQYLENDVMDRPVRGEPVWSGHFRADQMVFFAYHWLIRPDGTCDHLLEDNAIGWHAGNWDINTRSIAIALAGNYEHTEPPPAQVAATAQLIQQYYSTIAPERILGHCEIRHDLTCPGDHFLHGWKTQLLQQVLTDPQ